MKDMFENMSKMFGADIDPEEFQNVANQFAQGGFPNMGKGQKATVDHNKVNKMNTRARLQKKLEARKASEQEQLEQIGQLESSTTAALTAAKQQISLPKLHNCDKNTCPHCFEDFLGTACELRSRVTLAA